MLDDLHELVKTYLKHSTPYLNGFIGNPFCDKNNFYYKGIVVGKHNPNVLMNCLSEIGYPIMFVRWIYESIGEKSWIYTVVLMKLSKKLAYNLLHYRIYDDKYDDYITKMAIQHREDDFDVFKIIWNRGPEYCYLLNFDTEFTYGSQSSLDIINKNMRVAINSNEFINRLQEVLAVDNGRDDNPLLKDLIDELTADFVKIHDIMRYIKKYGNKRIGEYFVNKVRSLIGNFH